MKLFTKPKQTHRRRKQPYDYLTGKERGRDKLDKQQGPTVQHRALYSVSCNKL